MQVTSHQMHNVIECYSKKLSRARKTDKPAGSPLISMAEELAISPETARNATMEKICRQVLDKIADVVAPPLSPEGMPGIASPEGIDSQASKEAIAARFTLNVMQSIDRKQTANSVIRDSAGLIRRMDT